MKTEAIKEGAGLIADFKNEIGKFLKGIKDETSNAFEIGLSKYIHDRQAKFSKVNTFFSRDEKEDFYDVYFSLTLSKKGRQIKSDKILDSLFKETNTGGILGIAGSGKTMLLKHIFLSCKNELFKIPIYIELRDLNNYDYSITEYVYKIILENKIKPNTKILERSLESGKFLFLFDGFDELSLDRKDIFISEVDNFIDVHNQNNFLFTSRPGTNIESLPRLIPFTVNALNSEEIKAFTKKQIRDDYQLVEKIVTTIFSKENEDYKDYVSNPLLLSMFILTFNNFPELPKHKNKFYWNVFDTLTTRHDSRKKGGYQHEKKSKFQIQEIENILKSFCIKSILERRFNFDKQYLSENLKFVTDKLGLSCNINDLIYDLTISLSLIINDGLDYKFPHRTMQDYFATLFIREQNDDAKKKIYKERISLLIDDMYSNLTLFDLCNELDMEAFYEYCLIPVINEFNTAHNARNGIKKYTRFLKNINLQYTISEHSEELTSYSIEIDNYKHVQILTYFRKGRFDFFDVNVRFFNTAFQTFINPYLITFAVFKYKDGKSGSTKKLLFAGLEDIAVAEIIKKGKMQKTINSLFDFFKNKEIELIQELQKEKQNKLSIWN